MKAALLAIAGVVVGLFVSFILIIAMEFFGAVFHPFPEGFTGTSEEMYRHVRRFPHWVLAVAVLAWAVTAFVGTSRPPPRPSSSVAGGKKRKDEEDDEMKKIREYSLLNRMVKFAAAWFVARHYFASLEAKLRLAASRFRVMNAFLSVPS